MIVAADFSTRATEERFSWPGLHRCDYQVEHALLFGLGSANQVVVRELEVWRREWAEWRDTILPKFIAAFPGRRPAACYIVGEIPARPVEVELPLSSPLRQTRCVYVVDRHANDGFTYCDLPEPYQRDEAWHLFDAGVIDDAERRRSRGYSRGAGLAAYQFEVGR